MTPFGWPFCLCGKRVKNVVTNQSATVIDIVSDHGDLRVRVATDDAGWHTDYRVATFADRFTLLAEPPRSAEIIPLDAYRVRRGNYPMNPLGAA